MGTTMSFLAFLAIYDAILRRITFLSDHKYKMTTIYEYKTIGDSFRNDTTGKLVFGNILEGIDNVLHNGCIYPEVDTL